MISRARALVLVAVVAGGSTACDQGSPLPSEPSTDSVPGPTVQSSHSPTILSSLGGTQANGWVLNDTGVAAGWSDVSGGRAVRWSEEGAAADLLGRDSGTRGINNSGSIVGWVRHPDGVQRGYVHVEGVRIDLQKLEPDVAGSARDINDDGTVVGISVLESGTNAVAWHRAPDGSYGAPVALGFGNPTESPRINGRGDIAFSAYVWNMHRPLIWPIGPEGEYGEPVWLGRPADGDYYAMDINDQGIVVGARSQPRGGDPRVAVVWLPGNYDAPIDLGTGEAWAINEKNQIVGVTGGSMPVFGDLPRQAALWTVDADGSITGPVHLDPPSGYQHGGARDINEEGWIIGSSWGPGEAAATLWKPMD